MYHPKSPKMRNVPKMNGVFIVDIHKRKTTQILNKHRHSVVANGVWCPVVDNTYFVARRAGTVYITGNTPIQGTAADVTNPAIIEFYALTQKPKYKAMNIKMLLTVYDSILVECPIKHKLEVAQLLKDTMEKDCIINGKKRHFMADIEASDTSWGEMTKLKLKSKGE